MNLGSSFKDLDATKTAMKMDYDLGSQFESYFIFLLESRKKKRGNTSVTHHVLTRDAILCALMLPISFGNITCTDFFIIRSRIELKKYY
jgi:hypothetical protein